MSVVGIVLVIVGGLTATPYSAPRLGSLRPPTRYDPDRPTCSARTADRAGLTSPAPDPAVCSTDLIARARTRIELRFGDRPGFVLDRDGDGWVAAPGAEPAGLAPADLTGLIRIGDGPPGIVERSYPAVVAGTAGPSVRDRLLPAPRGGWTDGEVRLTLDPRLQHVATAALRTGAPAGIVVLDARTGDVLVSASTPPPDRRAPAARPDQAAARRFAAAHDQYVRPRPDGRLADDRPDPWCPRRSRDGFGQEACWRWSHTARPDPVADPGALVNRGVGRRYELGSAFDVVVAATFLESGSGGPPPAGDCPGTSVPAALAASCHDTFVALADRLGRPAVAAQAQRLGLQTDACPTPDPWPTGNLRGIAASCIPATEEAAGGEKAGAEEADGEEAGGKEAADGEAAGTPLALAVVMAAVANGGHAVHPRLITSVTDPATGRTTTVPPTPPARAFTAETSRELRPATTTAGAGQRTEWAAGFLDTPRGPLGYAVVVEAAAPGDGRARELARAISTAIGETR